MGPDPVLAVELGPAAGCAAARAVEQMNLRRKMYLAQVPLLATLLVVAGLAMWTYLHLGRLTHEMLAYNHNSIRAVLDMTLALERLDHALQLDLLDAGHGAAGDLAANQALFEAGLNLQEQSSLEKGESQATARLKEAWREFKREIPALATASSRVQANQVYLERLRSAFHLVAQRLQPILSINQKALEAKSRRVREDAYLFLIVVLASAGAALVLGLGTTLLLTGRLLRPLDALVRGVQRIAAGDFDARVPDRGADELSRLAAEVNAMAGHLRQYRRQSLDELSQARRATLAAINSLPDPVLVFGPDNKLAALNQSARHLLAPGCEAIGAGADSLEPAVAACVERILAQVGSKGGAYTPRGFDEALKVRFPEGDKYLLPRATPIEEEPAGRTGVAVVLQDVTRPRRLDQMKDDLVATVAHEFRTPLTSLRMAVHLCLDGVAGPLSARQTELLTAARQDCERVQTLVEDFLDLSRIKQGDAAMRRRPWPAEHLLRRARDAQANQAALKEVELRIGPAVRQNVQVEREQIDLVFNNLIANAIRHTPAGGWVELSAQQQGNQVVFAVTDNGEGIAAEHLDGLFERFHKVPGRAGGGAGLGLFIAHQVVTGHGGTMGVDSEPGKGSRFWFALPMV